MTEVPERLVAALSGRYRIERQLGEGGMATVYLARDLKHNRNVALKVLKPELAAVVGAERFLAEIETTANLQHPHILPLFDSGEVGGFVFYVMPFVEGETLRDRLDVEKQLPVDEAVRIATNVAEALDYAHTHGVVHRDIKPSNILLQSGKPVISDFGIALAVGAAGGGRLTETGLSLGTPHYMSPEQATGDRAVGAATDVYALGCVLYEMLVGDPPYVGSTAQAILGKIVTEDADPVTKHRRAVPSNVDAAIRKALERLPADRFKTAAGFARALEDPGYRHGVATGVGAGHGAEPWKRAALVLAVLLVASTAGLAWALLRPEPELQIARFDSPFPEGAIPLGPMEFTPDGSALVYVGPSVRAGTDPAAAASRQLWIRRLDDPVPTPIAGADDVHLTSYLAVSPDGREVAFASETRRTLFAVPLEGGPRRQLAPSALGASEWTADGTVYFQSARDFQIYRVPASGGGEPERVTELAEAESSQDALRFLPGGRMAVFTAYERSGGPSTPEIWALDLDTGERRMLTQGTSPRYASSGHLLYVRPDGTLMAAPIDADAELGDAVALISDIRLGSGQADYALSSRGALAYATGGAASVRTSLAWVGRDGAEEPLGLDPSQYAYPRISPDGSRVAVAIVGEDDTDLWVFDFERLSRSRITYGGNNRYFPVWSPAGDRIAFSNGVVGDNALLSAAADGSGRTDTLMVREGLQFPTSWSSDGRFLAFYQRSDVRNLRDLWVWPLDGEPEEFLATPFQERAGAFSPDGAWLAYASQKSDRDEIYLRPYPGPGAEVVVSTDGGTEPVWARDGTELFYRTQDQMMAVDVTDPARPGAPKALWPDQYLRDLSGNAAPNYDVHPDGRFLVVRLEQTAERTTTHVVLNWIEELKARVPR